MSLHITPSDIARFWSHVDFNGPIPAHRPDIGPCYLWTAGTSRGYGKFRFGKRKVRAHRFAWEIAHGEIPLGMHALHHCDNPPCVRESHLWLGTHPENMHDMAAKGRSVAVVGDRHWTRLHSGRVLRGERHGSSRLTQAQVDEIRSRYTRYRRGGETLATLAKHYGTSMSTISRIVRREGWKE